jgi:hypothetical protein
MTKDKKERTKVRLRQEDSKYEVSLGYIHSKTLSQKKKKE